MDEFPKMSKWKFAVRWCLSTWFGLIRLHKYSADWDRELNKILDERWQTAHTGFCTIMFSDDIEVWTANAFYGYGNNWPRGTGKSTHRPSIKTMWRLASLHEYLIAQEGPAKVVERLKGNF